MEKSTGPDLPVGFAALVSSPGQRILVGVLSVCYAILIAAVVPFAATPGPVMPAVTITFATGVVIADLCTCFLLAVQYRERPSRTMLLLVAAYGYSGLMAVLHVLAFPGAWIVGQPLIGTFQTVGWLFVFWTLGYPILILVAVLLASREHGARSGSPPGSNALLVTCVGVVIAVGGLGLVTTTGQGFLPSEIVGERWAAWATLANWISAAVTATTIAAMWVVFRGRSTLFLWLSLVMCGFLAFILLGTLAGGRHTLGWNFSRISGFISAGLLLMMFLGDVARMQGVLSQSAHRLSDANLHLESRISTIVEQAMAGIAQIDLGGRLVFTNERFRAIVGRSPDHIAAHPVWHLVPDGDRIEVELLFRRLLAEGSSIEKEVRITRADGRECWIDIRAAGLLGAGGHWTGATVIVFDVTQRRELERTLIDSESALRRVVEGAPFPMMVHDEDGDVIHLSAAWLRLTGYSATQITTVAAWTELAHGAAPQTARADIERLFEFDGPVEEGEYTIRTANGQSLVWAFQSAPIGRDGRGKRLVVSMAADLTERKQSEDRVRLLMREVDHRAKNALAVVQSILLLSKADNPEDFVDAVLGRVQAMGRAHTLLASSHWAGADLLTMARDELAAYGGNGRVHIAGDPVVIAPNAAQAVSMLLHELATNAAKYGGLSRPNGRVELTWWFERGEALPLVAEWRESGGPPVRQPSRHGFGTNLLTRTVREQLRGQLTMDWNPQGLMVRFQLPMATYNPGNIVATAEPRGKDVSGSSPPELVGARVLVVEDETLTALSMSEILREAGLSVVGPVGAIAEAMTLVRSSPPDVALLDVNLSGEMSYSIADALEAMGVPYLFCTGYGTVDNMPDGRSIEVPVLRKPVSPANLLDGVTGLLNARGGRAIH
ncbi:chemotaxis protein CheY [Skermanella stibiiresistens SB22]|uniref:histidine kinase n=1 Tax=Skermanella stibiiresistens SB22 TaxID=1385369 RepID=W9HBJ0_9PROT|nr:PAS domain S-box protein [Skermanella stibiiresistens]EWY42077.1 chemotaxis protein CheY [Skermanella stibiiresistens SB22]